MSLFNASVSIAVCEQTGETSANFAEDVVWESLYSGNPYALNYWIQKLPKGGCRVDIFHLLSQVISEKHYHMIDTICDGFLSGKLLPPQNDKDVSSATYLLAFCPFQWQPKAERLSSVLYSLAGK
ncbi:unnamed protein product [Enterobius vermicularis]|uniref:START domain-containing protein n=1 Tax=Enterobius vermicularis TaxID=51028 RepID=A0A0N4V0M8_ENTVE|nr:unnamed protein product [Enterobius vermicularis]